MFDPEPEIDFAAAAGRLRGVVRRTPLEPWALPERGPLDLRLKLECLQETGSFKSRGAWNQVAQLTAAERRRGVVTTSSGNHGRALAWAAARAGVPATIVMPADAYANKVQALSRRGRRGRAPALAARGRGGVRAARGGRRGVDSSLRRRTHGRGRGHGRLRDPRAMARRRSGRRARRAAAGSWRASRSPCSARRRAACACSQPSPPARPR